MTDIVTVRDEQRVLNPCTGKQQASVCYAGFGFKLETEAAARSRRRRTWGYVEESDSEASCKDAAIAQHPVRTTKVYA